MLVFPQPIQSFLPRSLVLFLVAASNLSLASPRQSVGRHATSSLRTYGQGVISDSSKSCTCDQPSHVGLHPVPQQYVPLLLSTDGPVLLTVEERCSPIVFGWLPA